MKRLALILAAFLMAGAAVAVEPKEMLKDPALEARARQVGSHLACVVCQGETIDESGAEIAGDMRTLVRQRLTAGDSNDQIMAYMVSRYGDYVRMNPRFIPRTYLLWFGPFVLLLAGLFFLFRYVKQRRELIVERPLSADERLRAENLLNTDRGKESA